MIEQKKLTQLLRPPVEHIDAVIEVAAAAEEEARLELAQLEDQVRDARERHAQLARAVEAWRDVLDLVAGTVVGVMPPAKDVPGPHSGACVIIPHPHGLQCSKDCPTCKGGVS